MVGCQLAVMVGCHGRMSQLAVMVGCHGGLSW